MFHLARHLFKQANGAVDDRGDPATAARRGSRLPIWLKLVYTAFVCVLVPHYWGAYGPTNFLYFCDIALLLTLLGLWREDPLLVSMPAVGILLPQALWMTDFVSAAVGIPLTGMTSYMFDPQLSLFTRGLSFFHFWLPILLVWLVWRLGYDPAISRVDTAGLGAGAGLLFLDAGPTSAGGSTESSGQHQLCYGFSSQHPQTLLPQPVYLVLMLVLLLMAIFWPTHLLLRRFSSPPSRPGNGRAAACMGRLA